MYLARQLDLTGFDDQHIRAFGNILRRNIQRTSYVGDHTAGLYFHDIQDTFAGAGGGGHDHIHIRQIAFSGSGHMHDGPRRFLFNTFLQGEQLGRFRSGQVNLVHRLGQQSCADRTDCTGGAHHHGLAGRFATGANAHPPYFLHGIMGRPERTGSAVAVAGCDWQRCPLGHGNPCIPHNLGKRTEAHDLGTELLRQFCRLQQPGVGKFRPVCHDFARGTANGNEPALHLIAIR